MPKVSTDPIKPPDDKGVSFAKLHERSLQLRALHRVCYVDKELVDARPVQGLFLEVEALAGRRDAGVSDELGQSVPPSMPPRGSVCVTRVHLPVK